MLMLSWHRQEAWSAMGRWNQVYIHLAGVGAPHLGGPRLCPRAGYCQGWVRKGPQVPVSWDEARGGPPRLVQGRAPRLLGQGPHECPQLPSRVTKTSMKRNHLRGKRLVSRSCPAATCCSWPAPLRRPSGRES